MTTKTTENIENKKFTELIVVRHGQTDANRGGRLQGHLDSLLDEEGIKQAGLLAQRLSRDSYDALYCSDLSRAVATAEIIGAACNLTAIVVPELREWGMGELENITYEDARREYPDIMTSFKFDANEILIPGGETKGQFYQRISRIMDNITSRHPGGRVLVVAHGGVLQAMLKHVMGAHNSWKFLPRSSNTSYNKFLLRDDGWQLCCWNDTAHLSGVGGDI